MMKTCGYRLQLRCNERRLNRDFDFMELAHVAYIEGGADSYFLRWDAFRRQGCSRLLFNLSQRVVDLVGNDSLPVSGEGLHVVVL